MLSRRTSLLTCLGIALVSVAYNLITFANEDLGITDVACPAFKNYTQAVTNGSCTGQIQGDGVDHVHGLVNDAGEHHDEHSGCVEVNWHEDAPKWITKVCAPTYTCQDNPAVDLSNAAFISVHEMPYENAPGVNPPIFPLSKDYLKDIVFSDNTHVADTADGCQYTCNDKYRVSTGPCTATATPGSCTAAPTLRIDPPTGTVNGVSATIHPVLTGGTLSSIAVDTGGSGYVTTPTVTLNPISHCSATPTFTAHLTGGAVSSVDISVTQAHATATIIGNNIVFNVPANSKGSGYSQTNPPHVTVTGLPSGCTVPGTITATVSSDGLITAIPDAPGGGSCNAGTGTIQVTIDAPPAASTITCSTGASLDITGPGSVAGTPANATVDSTGTTATIVSGGSGYASAPAITVSGGTCTKLPSATATVVNGVVTAITMSTVGTGATAISNVQGTSATIPTNGGGSGYSAATPPTVTVTGGTCTTRPTATATVSAAGVVTAVTLTGANACTVAPILTIAPPANSCTGTGDVKKCVLNVCTGTVPPEALYCTDDQIINGHEDIARVRRADVGGCTDPQKCEWYCPTDKPVFCSAKNACVANLDACTCPTGQQKCSDGTCAATCNNICSTSAPSELKTNTDYPLIQCASVDTSKTHFRYKITRSSTTAGVTAVATINSAGTTAAITTPGSGYTAAPAITVTGGNCTTRPNAVATITGGSVTGIALSGAVGCSAVTGTTPALTLVISAPFGAADVFISDLYTVGTTVKHPTTFPSGSYAVTCLYGTASSTDAATMTTGTCVKPMVVKDGNTTCPLGQYYCTSAQACKSVSETCPGDTCSQGQYFCPTEHICKNLGQNCTPGVDTVQGCSHIYGYKGNTLSDEMWGTGSFDASFRCGSRLPSTGVTNPYRLAVGIQTPAFLQYDKDSTELFNSIAIGPVSTQTQNYTFTSATDVFCAVKAGDGYSTNNSCKVRTCVGSDCSTPQTFVVTPSANKICTKDDTVTYDIGCNDSSTDYARCANWFSSTGDHTLKVNGTIQQLACTMTTPPGAFGPVRTCTITLPSGNAPVTLFSGDANSFQTTIYSVAKDNQAPTGTLEYFTTYTSTTKTKLDASQYQLWQKQPITAVITCTDLPGSSDGSNCACAGALNNDTNGLWSSGEKSTDNHVGPDIMTYSRVFYSATVSPYAVNVVDTAGNAGPAFTPIVKVDSVPPKITASISGTKVTLNVSDPTEGGSGLWKATSSMDSGVNKSGSVLYRVGPKANPPVFGATCVIPVNQLNYYHVGETGAEMGPLSLPPIDIGNATSNVLAYCVEDNAGNVTRGVYPSEPVGCFSSSNMTVTPFPTIDTYKGALQTNIAANQYGYGLSADPTNATCFRGIISSNVNTLITNQYNANTSTQLSWSQPATLKNSTTPNTNGYYYHNFTGANNNTVTLPSTNPTGTGQKVVVVDGGNIQINSNIDYSGSDKTLVLIARKTNNNGGNIFINPSVTRLDAILIADGALMNATTTNASTTTSTTTIKNWIDDADELNNRLTINGRLYSFNTRGGSVVTSGTELVKVTGSTGKYFNGSQLVTNATPSQAAQQDLERLRVILNDGNAACTLAINYDPLAGNNIPPVLQRPAGYAGGSCSF